MQGFSVIEGTEVTIENIREAIELDKLVYDEEYYVTIAQCLGWRERNNRLYTMVKDDATGKIIAYANLSPVTEEYYERIKSGQFIDTLLPPEAIVAYSMPDLYNLYFSSIVIHPDYQNSQIFIMLFNAITRKLLILGGEEIYVKKMIADAVSDKGEKFCALFGMSKYTDSAHGSCIYEVELLPPKFRVSSRATKALMEYYEKIARELGIDDAASKGGSEANKLAGQRGEKSMKSGQVFISYSSKEMEIAGEACQYLEERGITCWIAPRNVNPGGNYATQIVEAIRNCNALVLLASESTNASGHVSNEVSLAFDNKKAIIPFKIQNIQFSDEYLYFLGRKHWIEAHENMKLGLEKLVETLAHILQELAFTPKTNRTSQQPAAVRPPAGVSDDKAAADRNKTYSRPEIVQILIEHTSKYAYHLADKLEDNDSYCSFKQHALQMFSKSLTAYCQNKPLECEPDIVDFIVDKLSTGRNINMQVKGLPGSGKGMLLQLAYYKMLDNFKSGTSDRLPYYIAANYFERVPFNSDNVYEQMKALMNKEFAEFTEYLRANPSITPVLFIEGIREHSLSKIAAETVLFDLLKPLGMFNRIVSIDAGLIKNRSRLKRIIPIAGNTSGYTFVTHPVAMDKKVVAKGFINSIIKMDEYDLDGNVIYNALSALKYPEIDIFLVRMVAKELLSKYDMKDIHITEMYEKLALSELYGDEDKLIAIAGTMFQYIFDDSYSINDNVFSGVQWSLPNKHHTYLEFLIAYYFIHQIENYRSLTDYSFFKTMLTSMANQSMVSFMRDNYSLQETLLSFVTEKYEVFNVQQKSNAAYWLGRLTYKNLSTVAISFLTSEFSKLKPLVKTNNKCTQENLDNHFLFRAVCTGLLFHGQANMMDEYLCIVVTNDIANALNRGATIEYFGDDYQMVAHDAYYLDTDLSIGEQALKALSERIENTLYAKTGKFVENNLVTMLTLLQARIQNKSKHLNFDVTPYAQKALDYLNVYQTRPQNVASAKIIYYFESVRDDLGHYLTMDKFDIGPMIYNKYRTLKQVKRTQWTRHNIDDPESISEHTFNAWLLAVLFLPEEIKMEGYNKREVLDMLMVHDMSEAELGDQVMKLSEPSKDLSQQNDIMRKLFLKGTYPDIANLTYYYNIWTGYYNGNNINAKTARDVNLIQTVYTFCEYYSANPGKFSHADAKEWLAERNNLMTEVGYELFNMLILGNSDFSEVVALI